MPRKATRAASGSGSIRQRPDGRWEARVSVGINPATGKPIRRSIYGSTQAEVRKEMTSILRELDKGSYITPSKLKLSDWLGQWMETFCANTVRPLTFASYDAIIRNHINPAIGRLELQTVKGIHIQGLYNTMTDAGLSAKTVKNVSAVLHKAFSTAMRQGYITMNPCDGAELPKAVSREIKPLTDSEIPLFLEAIKDSPLANAYALCLFAGLREGECLGLSWSQVDFESGRLTISQQLQREKKRGGVYYIAPTTKSGKPRTIEPPPIAFRYLRDEQQRQELNRLQAGELWSNQDGLVFTDEFGKHLATITFYRHFKKIAERIGRPDARPHDLRHTAATVAIAAGADVKSVQSLLGHATASFTLDKYAHSSERMMRDTASRVQSYYDDLEKKG